jgi:Uma2 family endonuclease
MHEPSTPKEAPMRAVMWEVPPEVLEWRKRTGADRRDEVWDGVLHMGPSPSNEHQRTEGDLEYLLRSVWTGRSGGAVLHQINVARGEPWQRDFRIPDLVLILPGSRAIDRGEYYEGGPDVVVEIQSPHDETYEKLPFYAQIGVREVWIVERDTKAVEIHALRDGAYGVVSAGEDGRIASAVTGLLLRGTSGRVELRWVGES